MPSVMDQDYLTLKNQYRALSEKYEKLKAELIANRQRYEIALQQPYSLGDRILEVQISCIQELRQVSACNRNFSEVTANMQLKLERIVHEYVTHFSVLLAVQESSSKEQLVSRVKEIAQEAFGKFIDEFHLGPEIDLAAMQKSLEKRRVLCASLFGDILKDDDLLAPKPPSTDEVLPIELKGLKDKIVQMKKDLAFWRACEKGQVEKIRAIVDTQPWYTSKKKFVNSLSPCSSHTPLELAVVHGKIEAVKCLLELGADPTIQCTDNYQPLHWAAYYGHKEIATLLMEMNAPINGLGNYDRTPLHMAARAVRIDMLKHLIKGRQLKEVEPIFRMLTKQQLSVKGYILKYANQNDPIHVEAMKEIQQMYQKCGI